MTNKKHHSTGALPSKYDVRTFKYRPDTKSVEIPYEIGERYSKPHINQHREGICTADSIVQLANNYYDMEFSEDAHYMFQKEEYDNKSFPNWQWGEGSSILVALKVAKNIGLVPRAEFDKWATEEDRKLPYREYVKKLKAVPAEEKERLKKIASQYKIKAYSYVKPTTEAMAAALYSSNHGILARFTMDNKWYREPIEPLSPPTLATTSGHAVGISRRHGDSFRVENSWGDEWGDTGTAYFLNSVYSPTEAWKVEFNETSEQTDANIRRQLSAIGRMLNYIQKILDLLTKQKKPS